MEWKHKTFPRLFFDGCDGIAGRSRSELPGFSPLLFAIHRFDTVGRYVGEHDVTRGYAVALTHAHLPIFPPSPRYLPFFMTSPSLALLLLAILFPIGRHAIPPDFN